LILTSGKLAGIAAGDPDMEYALIDGTIVSVHQKATGAPI
jgi:hypothetical protein